MSETEKKARQFYRIFCSALFVYAALAWRHGHFGRSKVLAAVSIALIATFVLAPAFAVTLFKLQHQLLSKLGGALTTAFLVAFFYTIFTPYGLLLRVITKDPMQRKYEPKRKSYWIERADSGASEKACESPY